jgi:hypothetical protein
MMLSAKGEMASVGVGVGAGASRDDAFGGGDVDTDDIPF